EHVYDRKVEVFRESVVAGIAGWHGHDGARSVSGKDVVGDPDGYGGIVKRIDGVSSRKCAADAFHLTHALPFRAVLRYLNIFLYFLALLRRRDLFYKFMFRRQHHKRNAVDGVDPRGKYINFRFGILNLEFQLTTGTLADPVALHFLDGLRPVDGIQA